MGQGRGGVGADDGQGQRIGARGRGRARGQMMGRRQRRGREEGGVVLTDRMNEASVGIEI